MLFCKTLVQECVQRAYKNTKTIQANSEGCNMYTINMSLMLAVCGVSLWVH